jgi:cytochrome c biogenesis protein CcmG/thiol:disulfide interchange protein DsbE
MSVEASPRPGERRGCLIIWCAVALALIGLSLAIAHNSAAKPPSGLAPDFTLSLYDDQTITLSKLRGQVVVVNFWASWCGQCANEAPALEQAWQAYHDQEVSFIGVDCDDIDAEGRKFIAHYNITYPNGLDLANHISDAYVINGVPETFFVDRQGEVVCTVLGPLSYEGLVAKIEDLLGR